jgi:hypothetical protein
MCVLSSLIQRYTEAVLGYVVFLIEQNNLIPERYGDYGILSALSIVLRQGRNIS